MILENVLVRNHRGRFEVCEHELKSGSSLDIQINGEWLEGFVEHWGDGYFWFSKLESIPVILRNGIKARLKLR